MYTLLENIAKELNTELDIDCFVMPYATRSNTSQLVIFPKSLMDYEQGADKFNRGSDYLRVDEELHIDIILMAKGKTRAFVEDFYTANKKVTKKFRRPYNYNIALNTAYNVKVHLQKVENGGEYWTNQEGDENDDLYTLSELWQGVIKMKNHE
jgi:hypothetical protein